MENLDIEKLSRETPYKLPKNTFEIMQSNVLEKTLGKKQTPIFQLNWLYAAAAVILLIVGVNSIINTGGKKDSPGKVQMITQNQVVPQQNETAQNFSSEVNNVSQNLVGLENGDTSISTDLTSEPIRHLNVKDESQTKVNLATAKKIKSNQPTGVQIDEVLDGFSSSEIASLSNNTEQDVYLDLYN